MATAGPQLPTTRSYQQEMLEASLLRNIVIAMDTGSGKTRVAILRMGIEAEREPAKISWFLAPTVSLCEQQREAIKASLPLTVGLISGALEPNQWTNSQLWKDALATYRIIVSTPQVLLDALRHGYINIGRDIGLLVFDEAHHAADKHPYNLIMQEFYFRCNPRATATIQNLTASGPYVHRPFILGLTASPIFGGNVSKAFGKIEKNLDSVILGPQEFRRDLSMHVHRPVFKHIIYSPWPEITDCISRASNVCALTSLVQSLNIEDDPTVRILRQKLEVARNSNPDDFRRIDQRLSRAIHKEDTFVHKGLRDFLRTARELCFDLGPWAADWYVATVINKALTGGNMLHDFFTERHREEKQYLINALRRVTLDKIDYEPEAIEQGCSDKFQAILGCLQQEKLASETNDEVYSGLIFVTRRDGVLALAHILAHHSATKDVFSVGVLLGNSECCKRKSFMDITRLLVDQQHSEVLADFRGGVKNIVIATAVAEEGLDIQACGNVIRWDLPNNMVSWVQSRGRARKRRSSFILMFEAGGSHVEEVKKWELLEAEMVQGYQEERRSLQVLENDEDEEEEDLEFVVPSTGAKVTLHSVISHIAHFCNSLQSRMHPDLQPTYEIFPPEYPLGYHSGPAASVVMTRNPGPYGAILTLPRFIPRDKRVFTTEAIHKTKQSACRHVAFKAYVILYNAGLLNEYLLPIGGSIFRLQDEEVQNLLKDIEKRDGLASVREQMNPWLAESNGSTTGNPDDEEWWSNELAVEGLGNFVFLTRNKVPTLAPLSDVLNDPDYGSRLFTLHPGKKVVITASRLMTGRTYTRRLFSIFYGTRLDWDNLDYAYLIIPPERYTSDIWEDRRTWADSMRKDGRLTARDHCIVGAAAFGQNFRYPSDIVAVIGSGFYRFQRWSNDPLSSECEDELRKRYSHFDDYELVYPVILAQPLHARRNFLAEMHTLETHEKTQSVILHPSYTSVILDNEPTIILSLLLPSILQSISVKLIAMDLHDSLLSHSQILRNIPIQLVQVAILAPSANARYNYERLETLGDSALKFVTSIYLLAKHPDWPEGYLTRQKDHIVSNSSLARAAILKKLYRWIVRRTFAVRKWKPDYLPSHYEITTPAASRVEPVEEDGSNVEAFVELSTKTLADVVEALIGASYLGGGFDASIACIDAFEIQKCGFWRPLSSCVKAVLERTETIERVPEHLAYPEAILGYTFRRKALLVEALMHSSCQSDLQSISYERMEFLGDAVLDIIIVRELYNVGEPHPEQLQVGGMYSSASEQHNTSPSRRPFTPGQLHMHKSALVNVHFLAYICLRAHIIRKTDMPRWDPATEEITQNSSDQPVHLAQCLLHSSSTFLEELRDVFARFRREKDNIERELFEGSAFPWTPLAGLQAPKFLSDMIESLLGAVYLDSEGDMEVVRGVMEQLGILSVLRRIVREAVDVSHPISRISIWAAKHQMQDDLNYYIEKERGSITCTLKLKGEVIASATERYKGKASEDDVRFRVAEIAIEALSVQYSDIIAE